MGITVVQNQTAMRYTTDSSLGPSLGLGGTLLWNTLHMHPSWLQRPPSTGGLSLSTSVPEDKRILGWSSLKTHYSNSSNFAIYVKIFKFLIRKEGNTQLNDLLFTDTNPDPLYQTTNQIGMGDIIGLSPEFNRYVKVIKRKTRVVPPGGTWTVIMKKNHKGKIINGIDYANTVTKNLTTLEYGWYIQAYSQPVELTNADGTISFGSGFGAITVHATTLRRISFYDQDQSNPLYFSPYTGATDGYTRVMTDVSEESGDTTLNK